MALTFGGGGTASISELIAKKNYAKAIDAIKAQLKAGKQNPQLLNQLADVLILAKKEKEAIQILMRVADEYAAEGWDAKAIAVLKKIDRLEPGRRDVQAKLSAVVKDKRPAAAPSSGGGGGGFEIGMEEIGFESPGGAISVPSAPARAPGPPPASRPAAPPSRAPQPEALDELPTFAPPAQDLSLDLGDRTMPAIGLSDRPTAAAPPRPAPAPVQDFDFGDDDEAAEEPPTIELTPEPEAEAVVEIADIQLEPEPEPEVTAEPELQVEPEAASGSSGGEFDDLFAQELMGAIDEAFGSSPPVQAHASERKGAVQGDFMSSPLFQGFSPEELVAILEGLQLHAFEPGEIILTQGAPGHSLFILSTGMVRAYVKDEHGVYRFVRDLEEGSFFGEFAIVTGQPRAATVTAATRCELLELDRGTLDAISISHPHVNEVLRQHYEARMKGA
jgi:Cyclic nucleotide-binding domain